ncbi:PhoX family phosphatase [Thiothrix subterranea]|uniref:PhoX family protein n=1 Tax=Thiothrix subterranea TaxID=2735563 RepID=UPI00192A9270|nr:PhoX family phosphatase [Thiothrix subterranea]QQZ30490.1 PhoX family phosphatase [Thiothrix subterranea]
MSDLRTVNHPVVDPDDIGYNTSNNPSFEQILEARMTRRGLLRGSFALMAASVLGVGLTGCGNDSDTTATTDTGTGTNTGTSGLTLSFNPVAKSIADALSVPAGYTATVLMAVGDPINNSTSTYSNVGTDDAASFQFRFGDHADGMHYFGLNAAGTGLDYSNATRGVLCTNHEVSEDLGFMHAAGPTEYGSASTAARPTTEIDKEVALHGVTVVEIAKSGTTYQVNRASTLNRRITAATEMELTGLARSSDLMVTAHSTAGTNTRGTINNCGNGYTPWGTYLTCEENWAGYFYRREDNAVRTAKEVTAFARYGIKNDTSGRYNWSRPGITDTTDLYRRWNAGVTGASAAADFRNVANTFGWIVEIDPFNPTSIPKKRTTMGRFAHEACFPAKPVAGKPVVFYMGDDSQNEYVYKFVSDAVWSASDANAGASAGDKYLNAGKLYVAKFNADGTGTWELLSMSNSKVASYTTYSFSGEADVVINARLAADAVGATKMDRPEWGAINPVNGEVYLTLTNNSSRGSAANRALDAANPRYYTDQKGTTSTSQGNVNGHIIRWKETGGDHTATTFNWDIYLFGAQADADSNINISGLTIENDFSSPDGLWFSQVTPGLLWVQTDDGAYTDVTNCMMLAALPSTMGDGNTVNVVNKAVPSNTNADQTVATRVGSKASNTSLRRFLVGPKGCEITGITETPDGKAIFVNIQHPGEGSKSVTDPTQFTSHWPKGGSARPQSATVVITRNDGGKVAV